MTATFPGYRAWSGPRPAKPLPPVDELIAKLPKSWKPTPPQLRHLVPAFCSRCDRPARLRFGPGGGLCRPCRLGELADRAWR